MRGFVGCGLVASSWVFGPFLGIGALLRVGWVYGPVGVLGCLGCVACIFGGPRGFLFSGTVGLVPLAMACAAPVTERLPAMLGTFGFGCYIYLINCKAFAPWEGFYRLITDTLRMQWYHEHVDLRGALDEIKPGRNFFGAHPHGILCSGWGVNCIWNSEFHKRTGPIGFLIDPNLRTKNAFFRVLCDWYKGENRYFEEATKERILEAMQRGDSLSIVPGGFQDATSLEFGKHRTVIKNRKGWVKYCLQYGYRLTPVYTFGEATTYYTWTGGMKFRLWLNDLGIPSPVIFGRWWIPFLPRPVPMLTYVGKPIELPKVENPTKEDVDLWHGRYLQALTALFDQHKSEAGFPDAVLEIW